MPRIQLKLMGALAALVLALVAFVGVLAERGLRDREMARIEESLEQRAQLVRELLAGATHASPEDLNEATTKASAAARARVTVIEKDGRVAADSEVPLRLLPTVQSHASRPEVLAARSGETGRHTRTSATVRRAMLYLALPPGADPEERIVRLSVDLGELEAAIGELRRELVLAGGIGLIGALLLSFLLSRITLQPVEELRDGVTAIAEGRLERRLHLGTHDELGQIGESINRVAEQLRNRLDEANAEKTRLEAVLGSMAEGVLVLDSTGHVTLANPRFQELLGVWADPTGKSPIDLMRNDAVHLALNQAGTRAESQVCELEVGARTLLMHAVAVPPVGAGGCVAVFHDVSEIRKLDQVRRDFLANASHELRTPLTSIQGFADTLMQDELPPEQTRRFVEVIARNAERLRSLIDDLLELSQIEGGRQALQLTEVDVVHLTRVLIEDMRLRLQGRSIEAEVHVDSALDSAGPKAWGDRRAVEQILTNLIDNAVKYTDEGGRIDIDLRSAGGRIEISVKDTGLGIPADEVDRVFERFYRVDKARSRALGGTGLGLAIVKHLVQAMGGDIRLESKLGEGSQFTFWLSTASKRG